MGFMCFPQNYQSTSFQQYRLFPAHIGGNELCSDFREEKGSQLNKALQPDNYHHQEKEGPKKLNGGG